MNRRGMYEVAEVQGLRKRVADLEAEVARLKAESSIRLDSIGVDGEPEISLTELVELDSLISDGD